MTQVSKEELREMDEEANATITKWTAAAVGADLLPPPFDMAAVATVFARLGQRLGQIYGVPMEWDELKHIGWAIAKGGGAVTSTSWIGTDLFKYVPGVNLAVTLLVQPPIVGYMTHSAGQAFKRYYYIKLTQGRELTAEEIRHLAESALHEKLRP